MLISPKNQPGKGVSYHLSEERALEPKEVAEILNVSTRSVIRLAERGEMVAFKVGNLWRFHRSDVDGYITKQKQKHQPPRQE